MTIFNPPTRRPNRIERASQPAAQALAGTARDPDPEPHGSLLARRIASMTELLREHQALSSRLGALREGQAHAEEERQVAALLREVDRKLLATGLDAVSPG